MQLECMDGRMGGKSPGRGGDGAGQRRSGGSQDKVKRDTRDKREYASTLVFVCHECCTGSGSDSLARKLLK